MISGRDSEFPPDKIIVFDSTQTGPQILIEADEFLFLVDLLIFESSCTFEGGSVP